MTTAIVVLALCLVASLAFNFGFFGGQSRPKAASNNNNNVSAGSQRLDVASGNQDRVAKLEADLEKKRKEVEEVKKSQSELKDELKGAKKRLHELKESDKEGDDLKKARAEVERQSSVQLEQTRHELAVALAEVTKLKADADTKGKRAQAERPVVEKKEEVITRVIRELSDVEKEKIARLEAMSASDKKKAIELTVELRNVKGRIDREKREAKRIYEEGRLARDKFRAVEMRLNRTLLENDLLKRAIHDIEKKTGQHAEHIAPTADELAQSDASMTARHAAEDKAADEAAKKLEEAEATNGDGTPAAHAPEASAAPAAPAAEVVVPQA